MKEWIREREKVKKMTRRIDPQIVRTGSPSLDKEEKATRGTGRSQIFLRPNRIVFITGSERSRDQFSLVQSEWKTTKEGK